VWSFSFAFSSISYLYLYLIFTMSIASSMAFSAAAASGSSTAKITQTALVHSVKAAHIADSSFASQLNAVLEYMTLHGCDFNTATAALAPPTVAIVSPPPSQIDSDVAAHSKLLNLVQQAVASQEATDSAHKALFNLYGARSECSDRQVQALNEYQQLVLLHASDPSNPNVAEARVMLDTVTAELSGLSLPTAQARDTWVALCSATSTLVSTVDTQSAAFLSTYGYAFDPAVSPSPETASSQKRANSQLDLARSALDSAGAATIAAELAVSECESLLQEALRATPVNPSEITRLALALQAGKTNLQDASTTQAKSQQSFNDEVASDAASKRARLASGRSSPPIVVSYCYLVRSVENCKDKKSCRFIP